MKVSYDAEVDALYIDLANGEVDTSEEVRPGVVFDLDPAGKLLGIEILDAKKVVAPGMNFAEAAE
jgi:uncharacterized protein YuzE